MSERPENTTITAGALQIGNGGARGSVIGNIANDSALAFNRSDSYTFAGVISGTGSLSQNGAGTLILTGDHSYTGSTTVTAGTLQIGDGGTTGSLTGNIVDNSALVFNRSDTLTYAGAISGTGSLIKNGAGTLILTGNNIFSGGAHIAGGELQLKGSLMSQTTVGAGTTFMNAGVVDAPIINNGVLNLENAAPQRLAFETFAASPTVSANSRMARLSLPVSATNAIETSSEDDAPRSVPALAVNLIEEPGFSRVTGPVTGTGIVNVNGTFTSENTFAASAFNINSGALFNMNHSIDAPLTVAGGGELRLSSAPQMVNGDVSNYGAIDLGLQTLTTTGRYTQASGATLKLQINNANSGGYGQLRSGQALNVSSGAIIFAAFGSPMKYPTGTVIRDVLQGVGKPANAGDLVLVTEGQRNISRYFWNAVWNGDSVDLKLIAYDGARALETLNALGANRDAVVGLMRQRYAMLNTIMDYDCSRFDKYGACLSIQARATGFGSQSSGSGVFNAALRLTERLRIGAFIDYQANMNSQLTGGRPFEHVEAYDNAPTFGGYAGYSEGGYSGQPLEKALQLSVSGGLNPGRIRATRAMFLDATGYLDGQPGSGSASFDAFFLRGMAGYGIDLTETARLMPYAGLRYTNVTRGAYAESENGLVTQPIAYDAFYERLMTSFAGAKISAMLTPSLGASLGLGAEVDIKRSASNYGGRSPIADLPFFSLAQGSVANRRRPVADAGVFYGLSPNQRVFLKGGYGQQAWSTRAYTFGMLGYQLAF